MKRILFNGMIILTLSSYVNAQDAADKKIQAGLTFGFNMNMPVMETKKIAKNGIGSELTIGTNVNYSLTETIALHTGLEFDFSTYKFKEGTERIYYYYNDTEILTATTTNSTNNNQLFRVLERKQKANYLTIPLMVQFRTNFIGYFRYFGKFGVRNSFLLGNKVSDYGYDYPLDVNPVLESNLATIKDNSNMKFEKSDLFFYRGSIGLGGGAEWNFIGSTSLLAEVTFYYGVTPLFWNRKDVDSNGESNRSLFTTDATGTQKQYINNSAKLNQLQFKLSILF